VVAHHYDEFRQIPGAYGVTEAADRVIIWAMVYTDEQGNKPATLPPALQAVPTTLEGVFVEIDPVYSLPPPPGVVVLSPLPPDPQTKKCPTGEVRAWQRDHFECYALAETCPDGFQETSSFIFGWRFCQDPRQFVLIPDVMKPPIAGVPYDQAQAVLVRHQAELSRLPGVDRLSLGEEGIVVTTKHLEAVPATIEGVPVIGEPVPEWERVVTLGGGMPMPTCTIERPAD